MTNAVRDENNVVVLLGVSSVDGETPTPIQVDSNGAILCET